MRRVTAPSASRVLLKPVEVLALRGSRKSARRRCGSHSSTEDGIRKAMSRLMIERACQLTLRTVAIDRKFAETGAQTDHDSRTYLAWSNSLSGHVFLPCAHALLLD
jgi:hypothetical protein